MGGIRLQVTGIKELRTKLKRLRDNLNDYEELWDRVAEIMIEHEETLFSTEGATASPPWPPLAPSTVAYKVSQGFPIDAMVRTGALKESLTSPLAGEVGQGRDSLGQFTSNVFSWGTDIPYAGYHVDPRYAPEHTDPDNPPIRNLVTVTPDLLAKINRAAEEWLEDARKEAGIA
jgi:phage gpG-like protein